MNTTKNSGEFNNVRNVENFEFDIDLDLTAKESIPLDSSSLEAVYTSHMIEHLKNDQVTFLFKDVYRLLQDGGVFRITCPDVDILYDELIIKKNKNFEIGTHTEMIDSAYEKFSHQVCGLFSKSWVLRDKDLVDEDVYQDFLDISKITETEFRDLEKTYGKHGTFEYLRKLSETHFDKFKYHLTGLHINWWNKDKLRLFLLESGFTKFFGRQVNESVLKDFKSTDFDYNSSHLSLYVEAIK